MNVLNRIIECEFEYIKCFCKADERQDFIRFQDKFIPDMYYHNYTWIKNVKDDFALIELIESEITHSKNIGKDFCLIRCHIPMNKAVLNRFLYEAEISVSGYYVFDDFSNLLRLNKIKDSSLVKVNRAEMLEDILRLDLEHDEKSLGRDFCTRRVYRRKDIYLSSEGVDSYICYHDNEAVGSCDLFIHSSTAKIEDFGVSPRHQRKGYGTTILKFLLEKASEKNVNLVYLETDEDGIAKEMYQKSGFSKINDFTDLLFKF